AFKNGTNSVFLISLKAGGTGLNLTEADTVIHIDPWWNPAVEDQASDRAYRMGQQKPVTVYRLVTKDTIEEKIIALHHDKRDLADQVLSATSSSKTLDPQQLLGLLEG
ncbi:MAG: SWF/SNF helicase family protein, partial [Gammaproteobacteria bacterium]|nr:SWF/SNF helicase family protein [Gammaproteobacteria bacterium]